MTALQLLFALHRLIPTATPSLTVHTDGLSLAVCLCERADPPAPRFYTYVLEDADHARDAEDIAAEIVVMHAKQRALAISRRLCIDCGTTYESTVAKCPTCPPAIVREEAVIA